MAERRVRPIFVQTAIRIYALMVWAYPSWFRRQFGREMRLAFESQVAVATDRAGRGALTFLLTRTTLDWIFTVTKEHLAMPKHVLTIALLGILIIVNFLAFHDLFEEHTVRDYLTVVASVLLVVQVALDVIRGRHRERTSS